METQLSACSDALVHTLKQKEVAKELLRQESDHSRNLAAQVHQLQALNKFVGWSLQAVVNDAAKVCVFIPLLPCLCF